MYRLLSSISPNGLFKALIRETEKGSQTDKLFKLEIWECNTLIRNYDLTALKIHGNVYADGKYYHNYVVANICLFFLFVDTLKKFIYFKKLYINDLFSFDFTNVHIDDVR